MTNSSSIGHMANRVLQVAQQEVNNSEDPKFVDQVKQSIEQLRASEL